MIQKPLFTKSSNKPIQTTLIRKHLKNGRNIYAVKISDFIFLRMTNHQILTLFEKSSGSRLKIFERQIKHINVLIRIKYCFSFGRSSRVLKCIKLKYRSTRIRKRYHLQLCIFKLLQDINGLLTFIQSCTLTKKNTTCLFYFNSISKMCPYDMFWGF